MTPPHMQEELACLFGPRDDEGGHAKVEDVPSSARIMCLMVTTTRAYTHLARGLGPPLMMTRET